MNKLTIATLFAVISICFAIGAHHGCGPYSSGCVYNNVPRVNQQEVIELLNQLEARLPNFAQRVHGVATKRCANLFDESCVNGGLPDVGGDDSWINGNNPGRR